MKKNRIVIFSLLLLIACLFTACGSNEDSKSAEILSEQSMVSDEIVSSKEESEVSLESNESKAEASEESSEEAHTHSFGEWVTSKNATCVEEGTKERLCSCGEKETETIEATGHIEGEWITDAEATCIKEGSKHLVCANCSESLKTETIQATGKHKYTSKVTTAATCVEEGVKTFTCSDCKDSYTETIKATGKHSYSSKVTTAATCTKDGVKTFTCKTCDDSYTEAIQAAHKWVNATCTAPKTCSVCKETSGDALGHKIANGKCTRCGIKESQISVSKVQLLGEYIKKNGYAHSNGRDYFIVKDYSSSGNDIDASIYWDTSTKSIMFMTSVSTGTSIWISALYYDPNSNKQETICIWESGSTEYTGMGYIYANSFSDNNTTIYSFSSDAPSYQKAQMESTAETILDLLLYNAFDMLKDTKLDISMSDLGFVNYDFY